MRLCFRSMIGMLLVFLALACNAGAVQNPGASKREEDSQQAGQGRREALLEERQRRLDQVKPAKTSRIVEIMDTIESEGFGRLITAQFGHFRAGFGKISPVSGFAPAGTDRSGWLVKNPIEIDVAMERGFPQPSPG